MKEPLELRGSLFAKKREREAWTGLGGREGLVGHAVGDLVGRSWVGEGALSYRLVGQVLPQFPKLFAFQGVGLV